MAMCGGLSGLGEVVDQRLGVGHAVVDQPGELALQVRVVRVEPLGDERGVAAVLGEDDGLARAGSPSSTFSPFRIRNSSTLSTVSSLNSHLLSVVRLDPVGDRPVLVPFERVPLLLLLVGEVVVADALALELQRHRDRLRRHQVAVGDRVLEVVGVGRHAALELEQRVGVAVDLVPRRRGQPDQQAVEILEDRPVLAVDRAVRLVDHDQVEMPGPEAARAVLHLLDQVHHRRVGREEHPRAGVVVLPRVVPLEQVGARRASADAS